MASLRRLMFLGLLGIAHSQRGASSSIEFLAPREGEVVTADSTFEIKWVAGLSTGRGTMILLAGQTSKSLNRLWEIAYSIDVNAGSFSWPVGKPTVGAQLLEYYALNLSLDGSEGSYGVSPTFRINGRGSDADHDGESVISGSNRGGKGDPETPEHFSDSLGFPDNKDNNKKNGHSKHSNNENNNHNENNNQNKNNKHNENNGISNGNNGNRKNHTSSHKSTHDGDTPYEENGSGPQCSLVIEKRLSTAAIGGIVAGVVTVVTIISGLVALVIHYRSQLREERKRWQQQWRASSRVDDDLFEKVEPDTEVAPPKSPSLYELTAVREVQQADGKMKPAELNTISKAVLVPVSTPPLVRTKTM